MSSNYMTMSLTGEKKNEIKTLLTNYLHCNHISVRELARGNLEGKNSLSSKAVSEIHWWINKIYNSCHHISNIPNPDITIYTGWGMTSGI